MIPCVKCKGKTSGRSRTGLCRNCWADNGGYYKLWNPQRRKAVSKSKIGRNNPMWKGDEVGYSALHGWVAARLPRPDTCNECGNKPQYKIGLDLANKGTYDRNLDNWEWLCRTCHMAKDGRLEQLASSVKEREKRNRHTLCPNCQTVFDPGRPNIVCCSLSCSVKWRFRRKRIGGVALQ